MKKISAKNQSFQTAEIIHQNSTDQTSTSKRVSKFFVVGITLALSNYLFYTFLALAIIKNSELLWLSSLVSTSITTVLAYILHSKITWKERQPAKTGVVNFFVWNALLAVIFSPSLTWFFGLFTPLYELALQISEALHLPFNFDFIESTGVFILVNIVTMILNYFFYDRLVFSQKKDRKENKTYELKN